MLWPAVLMPLWGPALQLGPLVGGILSIQYRQVECQPPGGVRVVVTAFNGPGLYFRLTIQVPHPLPVRCCHVYIDTAMLALFDHQLDAGVPRVAVNQHKACPAQTLPSQASMPTDPTTGVLDCTWNTCQLRAYCGVCMHGQLPHPKLRHCRPSIVLRNWPSHPSNFMSLPAQNVAGSAEIVSVRFRSSWEAPSRRKGRRLAGTMANTSNADEIWGGTAGWNQYGAAWCA